MKKLIILIAFIASGSVQHIIAQTTSNQTPLSTLLTQYYQIKDALVGSNGAAASQKADEFLKTLNSIDYKVISEGNVNALLKDATAISATKDLKKQREYFPNFSNNMIVLAKTLKLTSEPIYQAYCPMKKANWLAGDKVIKNPYYGSSMLTCGQVVQTIN